MSLAATTKAEKATESTPSLKVFKNKIDKHLSGMMLIQTSSGREWMTLLSALPIFEKL